MMPVMSSNRSRPSDGGFIGIVIVAVCVVLLAAPMSRAQTRLDPNEIITIELDGDGTAEIALRLERAAEVHFDVFSGPDSLAEITIHDGTDDQGEGKQTTSEVLVLGPGRHRLQLAGSGPNGPAGGLVQGRLSARPPNDAFEPNDRIGQARAIDLPFHSVIRIANQDWDWFRVDPPRRGVLGIQLHAWTGSYAGPEIRVADEDGELLYVSPSENGGWSGMRYVEVSGRPVFVGVTDPGAWQDRQTDGYKSLEIVMVEPIARMQGQLITLGVEADDPSLYQLAQIGNALGVDLRAANEAETVASELARVVEGRRQGGMSLFFQVVLGLLGLAAAGAGFWFWRRRNSLSTNDDPAPKGDEG
ncbi:hypothetical protein [Maricaulis sp.]|uniref:hypothetical protein n=1 Tax=Maricaulis sp. TaxID=1486257 RepID=UPI003A8D053B